MQTKNIFLTVTGILGLGAGQILADDKVDFVKDIQPILQKICVECHGPEKQKGKLRLDSKEAALKGGTDGVVLVPGKAADSDLYRRITLPPGHDDIMPNKGEPLTKAQTDLFKDWINQGAVWPDNVVIKPKTSAEPAVVRETKPLPDWKPTAAETKAVADLEALGVSARPIAMNVGWRQANFNLLGSNVTDTTLLPLKNILGMVDLNLAGTKITDAGLASLAGLTNLQRLHLEKTQVTDAGLAHLKGLVNLHYLNLYGTSIGDAGLEPLKGLANLKNIYLWQTKVTDEGVAKLQKALPKLDVSRGWELLAKVVEKKIESAKPDEKKADDTKAKADDKKAEEPKAEKKADDKKVEDKKAEDKKATAEEKKEKKADKAEEKKPDAEKKN